MAIAEQSDASPDPRVISVVVVGKVRLYREGLSASLATRAGLVVVGAAADREAAVALVTSGRPDVVVLDMATPESLDMARAISGVRPVARIVAFAVVETDHDILACAEAGMAAWVPQEGSIEDLVATIESVVRDELQCPPKLASTLFRRLATLARRLPQRSPADGLTAREREIVVLIDRGLSNKEIAVRLSLEVTTVKNHVHNILDKLQVSRRTEAVALLRASCQSGRP